MHLSAKSVLLLAQGWNGTLYSMKNFADMNEIDWDMVVDDKDPTSNSKTAYAESLVNRSLKKDEHFLAYLNEVFSKEDYYIIKELNKDLANQDLAIVLDDNKWRFVDKSETKENPVFNMDKLELPDKVKLKVSNPKTKDKKRTLTHAEKIWVWENKPHECYICGKEVEKFSEAHFDHTKAHAKKGKTTPANSGITHILCNKLKGKKSLREIQKYLGIKSSVERKPVLKQVPTEEDSESPPKINEKRVGSQVESTEIMEFSEANYLNPKEFGEFLDYLVLLDEFHSDEDKPPMSAQRFVNLFKLMRECNLKVSEVINLRKGDFDVRHKIIMIRYPNSDKVQKTTTLPKDDIWLQKFLLNYNDEDKIFPVNSQTVYQYATDACTLAGLKDPDAEI